MSESEAWNPFVTSAVDTGELLTMGIYPNPISCDVETAPVFMASQVVIVFKPGDRSLPGGSASTASVCCLLELWAWTELTLVAPSVSAPEVNGVHELFRPAAGLGRVLSVVPGKLECKAAPTVNVDVFPPKLGAWENA